MQEDPAHGGYCTEQQRECPHHGCDNQEIRCDVPRTAKPRAADDGAHTLHHSAPHSRSDLCGFEQEQNRYPPLS